MKNNNFLLFFLLCTGLQLSMSVMAIDPSEKPQEVEVHPINKASDRTLEMESLRHTIKCMLFKEEEIGGLDWSSDVYLDNCVVKFFVSLFNQEKSWAKRVIACKNKLRKLKEESQELYETSFKKASQLGLDKKNIELVCLDVARDLYNGGWFYCPDSPQRSTSTRIYFNQREAFVFRS